MLAGGQSSRMGRPKAAIKPWGENGPTLLEHAREQILHVVGECCISVAPGMACPYQCVVDKIGGQGPAYGIMAGLELAAQAGYKAILALACDLPLMRPALLARLADACNDAWITCYKPKNGGKIEMLAAIYSVDFLPLLATSLQKGEKSLFRIAPPEHMRVLEYSESEAACFHNCNTPGDLEALHFLVEKQGRI